MADASKSIQVTVDIIVEQAKAALSGLASTTTQATQTLESMSTGSTKGAASIDAIAASGKKGATSLNTVGKAATATGEAVTDSMGKSSKASSGFFSDMAKDVTKGLIAYDLFKKGLELVVDFLKGSIDAANDADEKLAQLGAVLRSTGEAAGVTAQQALDLSKAIERNTTYSDEAVLSAENLLLTFTKIGSNIFPQATQAVIDMSAAMGQDLQSSAIQVGKALQDPILGVSALRRVGVNFSESQQEVIKNLVETGNAAKAQQMILTELANEFGGSAAAKLKTFSGQMEHLKNTVDDTQEVIGGGFIVALSDSLAAIQGSSDAMLDSAATMNALGKSAYLAGKVVVVAFEAIRVAIVSVADVVHTAQAVWDKSLEGIVVGVEGAAKALNAIGKVSDDTVTSIDNVRVGLHSMADDDMAKLTKSGGETMDAMAALTKAFGELNTDGYEEGIKKHQEYVLGQEATKKAMQQTTEQSQDQKDALKALADGFQAVMDKQTTFTFDTEADFGRFQKVLADTKTKQDDWIKDVSQGFDAFSNKLKGVNDDIKSLTGKLNDAQKAFGDFVTSTTKSSGDDFAKIVHDAEQAVQTLPQQIANASSKGQDTSDLQKQLSDAQATIQESHKQQYQSNQEFLDELSFLRSQDGKNELAQAYAVMQQKIDAKKKETDETVAEIQKQIDAATAQKTAYEEAQAAMTLAFTQNVALRKKNSKIEIDSLALLTTAVNQARDSYNQMAAAASAASRAASLTYTSFGTSTPATATTTKRAQGGPVASGSTYLVGEKGPELFTPNNAGTITPTDDTQRMLNSGAQDTSGRAVQAPQSAGSINITINNPTVRNDNDIREIVSQVEEIFSRRDELARMGAWK